MIIRWKSSNGQGILYESDGKLFHLGENKEGRAYITHLKARVFKGSILDVVNILMKDDNSFHADDYQDQKSHAFFVGEKAWYFWGDSVWEYWKSH